jgi:hypothetical protein
MATELRTPVSFGSKVWTPAHQTGHYSTVRFASTADDLKFQVALARVRGRMHRGMATEGESI